MATSADGREVCKAGWLQLRAAAAAPHAFAMHKKARYLPEQWTVLCVHNERAPHIEWYMGYEQMSTHVPLRVSDLFDCAFVSPAIDQPRAFTIGFRPETNRPPMHFCALTSMERQEWIDVLNHKLQRLNCLDCSHNVYTPFETVLAAQSPLAAASARSHQPAAADRSSESNASSTNTSGSNTSVPSEADRAAAEPLTAMSHVPMDSSIWLLPPAPPLPPPAVAHDRDAGGGQAMYETICFHRAAKVDEVALWRLTVIEENGKVPSTSAEAPPPTVGNDSSAQYSRIVKLAKGAGGDAAGSTRDRSGRRGIEPTCDRLAVDIAALSVSPHPLSADSSGASSSTSPRPALPPRSPRDWDLPPSAGPCADAQFDGYYDCPMEAAAYSTVHMAAEPVRQGEPTDCVDGPGAAANGDGETNDNIGGNYYNFVGKTGAPMHGNVNGACEYDERYSSPPANDRLVDVNNGGANRQSELNDTATMLRIMQHGGTTHEAPRASPRSRTTSPRDCAAAAANAANNNNNEQQLPLPAPSVQLTLKEREARSLAAQIDAGAPLDVRLALAGADSLALVEVHGALWVAGWTQAAYRQIAGLLHVGDRVLQINGTHVNKVHEVSSACRGNWLPGQKVAFTVRRLPHARVFSLRRRCDTDDFGVRTVGTKNTISHIAAGSPAESAGVPQRMRPALAGGASATAQSKCASVPCVVTEVNGRPVSVFSKRAEVAERLSAIGKDITLLVQPHDLIKAIKAQMKSTVKAYKDFVL